MSEHGPQKQPFRFECCEWSPVSALQDGTSYRTSCRRGMEIFVRNIDFLSQCPFCKRECRISQQEDRHE